jgi:hypothetical protein
MIVRFAGEHGIPPQVIKAQIERESGFKPAYRWEPFVDADYHGWNRTILNNRHRILSLTDLGTPGIPTNHTNVFPHPYWGYQGSAWDLLFRHSSDLNTNVARHSSQDLYPRTNSAGSRLWYEEPYRIWENVFTEVSDRVIKDGHPADTAFHYARAIANEWLRDYYLKGALKNVAQTRIASSYGLLQTLYATAIEKGYPPNTASHPPERLNESERSQFSEESCTYGTRYLSHQLNRENVYQGNGENNWLMGWEPSLQIALSLYNSPGSFKKESRVTYGYGIDVIHRSQRYLPGK